MPASTVRDIMDTDGPTVGPDDSVESVVKTMRQHELPGIPVINEGGRCVGIITEDDLIMEGDENLHLPHYIELFGGIVFLESMKHFEERLKKAHALTAKDLMTADPVTIGPDESVRAAAKVISHKRHNRLPVIEHGQLVGVITRVDVLAALSEDED